MALSVIVYLDTDDLASFLRIMSTFAATSSASIRASATVSLVNLSRLTLVLLFSQSSNWFRLLGLLSPVIW